MHSSNRQLVLACLILLLTVLSGIKDPSFFSAGNFRDITVGASYVVLLSLGMLFVVAMGEIDVSIGAILTITGAIVSEMALAGYSPPVFCLVGLVAGAFLGVINGLLVVGLEIPSIVATLGTLSVYRGGYILITEGKWITTLPESILQFGRARVLGFPVAVLITLAVFALVAVVLGHTSFGRNVLCVGSSPNAARLAGIPIKRTRIAVFVLNGVLVGAASILYAGLYGSFHSGTGIGIEMTAITAVVVGGASIVGGSASSLGAVLGAVLISMISTVLIFFRVNAYWEQAMHGFLILAAVGYYSAAVGKRRRLASSD